MVDAAEADQTPAFRHPPLGLVLGDRERDVERLRGDLELLARPGEVDVPLLDVFVQPAEAGDLDLDDVAGAHRPRVRGRAGEHDVAGLERDRPAQVGELVRDREEEVARGRLLDDVAVQVGAEREVGRVELGRGDELRAEREEAVLPLDAQHRAAVGVPEVVHADVVRAGVAGDVGERVLERDALHPLARRRPRARPRS